MLVEQSTDDDKAHILALIDFFKDPRYIRVQGRPLLVISFGRSVSSPGRASPARHVRRGARPSARSQWPPH